MANPTQVLIGIPARVNAGAAIAAAGVLSQMGQKAFQMGRFVIKLLKGGSLK
jgi:hypothetical protein